ncbi:RNA polymerase C-22 sterol desaturase [Cytospora paraplurivora]|uniref:sterol 22-desaturase n=1 Tax=Cytospora paraplurivora TaxID=2898453 RepID=A0AAN9U006_9PEZI
MDANATSFTSPLANAQYGSINVPPQIEYVVDAISKASLWTVLWTLLAIAVAYDQISYLRNKGSIVGPAWKAPFIGPFLQSVNPKFEEYYGKWQSGELSCVSVFHKFVVIASTRDMSRKIFNSPTFVKPCVVDVAHKLLGADNWVFLDGKAHVDFRKGLNGLFTRKALESYLPGQEEVYNRYFKKFVQVTKDAGGKPVAFMGEFREIITAVSLRTFVGHYVSDEAVKKIADDYYLITEALELVNFPIILPYTKTWYGKKAADMVLAEFSKAAAKSKVRMAAGGEISCIMDGWVKIMVDSGRWREAEAKGQTADMEKPSPLLRDFTDYEIAQTLFTFLFASQDATSSAATWLFQIMAQRPDVLDRLRDENLKARNGDIHAAVTMDQLESMTYTRAVVRELLRYRPPVLMVPYVVKKPFPITDTYTVPKGAMVIPTTYMALRDPEVYEKPDEFNPERYYTGDAEEKGAKNWLVFGTGPHYCLGQHYAMFNLALMIGKASLLLDWKHHPTPRSEEIKVFATIFPMRTCLTAPPPSQYAYFTATTTMASWRPTIPALRALRQSAHQSAHQSGAAAAATTASLRTFSVVARPIRQTAAIPARQVTASLPATTGAARRYSQQSGQNKVWSFEDVQKATQDPESKVVIVDTREPGELVSTGHVPGAINIPVASSPDSFHITEEDFEDRFGYARPEKDTEVVFYCKAGVRSRALAGLARDAGWTKVGEYPGSWLDWVGKGGKIERS